MKVLEIERIHTIQYLRNHDKNKDKTRARRKLQEALLGDVPLWALDKFMEDVAEWQPDDWGKEVEVDVNSEQVETWVNVLQEALDRNVPEKDDLPLYSGTARHILDALIVKLTLESVK